MNLYSNKEQQAALEELKSFIELRADVCLGRGWSYFSTNKAPESFKALKERTLNKHIPIADYGSDTSIYGSKKINTLFRFWHDVTHIELNQGFSKAGEYAVIEQHLKEAKEAGLSSLAQYILDIDTRGQVDYYFRHKEFVVTQDAFLDTCLKHGITKAIKVKH